MKVYLMDRERDFDLEQKDPWNEPNLSQDLELTTLFNAMARGDRFLFEVARKAVLCGARDLDTMRYRQAVLRDCLNNPAVVRDIYQLPIESIERKHKQWLGIFAHSPASVLSGAHGMLQMFVDLLRRLKAIADEHAGRFESEGFKRFFTMIEQELDDEYFACVEDHLKRLCFRSGVLISAELGQGNEGTAYVLRKPPDQSSWVQQIVGARPPTYSFRIYPRDDHGARALGELKERGINLVANALAQSADHIDSFFTVLRVELAFYLGCLNLYERLDQLGEPVCFPDPVLPDERRHSFRGLYDVCLALTMGEKVVGNEGKADHKALVIVTGANEGGKSTFLRSIGLAQLMMQGGLFVPAESFCANLCNGLFTHYKREEDVTMGSGKFDEELSRMSEIVDHLRPHSLVLFNESFAATNDREGSEIAGQIVRALLEKRIKVFFVTHLYEFAHRFYGSQMADALFLRAERQPDGSRTFKLIEGAPLQTSYGPDLYKRTFETDGQAYAIGEHHDHDH